MAGAEGLEESELREGTQHGGSIQGFIVVARESKAGEELTFVAYLRVSWMRGYKLLQTWRHKSERTAKTVEALLQIARKFSYHGPVTIFYAGHPDLQDIRGISDRDKAPAPNME